MAIKINKDFKDVERDPFDATQFTVGDILVASFQYSAKIPYFYKVVRKTKSMVFTIKLSKKNVSDDGYGQNGTCVPVVDSDPENGKIYKGRISTGRISHNYLKLDGCLAKLWDGEPVDFYTD